VKAEEEAARKLRLAKRLEADGVKDKAKGRYQDIIRQCPKTKAAQDAQELLEK
jgi:TolA-binding protein